MNLSLPPLGTSLLGIAALALGCATGGELTPADGARTGREGAAFDRVAGVRISVDSEPRLALPAGTQDDVTPLAIAIENQSDVPLRVRYRELRLVEPKGNQLAALPPLQVDAAVPLGIRPSFGHSRFGVAPAYEPFYGTLPPTSGTFTADPLYYSTYYPRWVDPLPTSEMVARALPEGVLEPGGALDGLVYFEGLSPLDERAVFVADLVNAETGAELGQIRIPFAVARAGAPLARR